jgi:glycosyltransferase involved in cell wall biosynthesis
MRILHLIHQYMPRFITGTEVLTHETAKAQVAAGHQVEVLTAEPTEDPALAGGPETTDTWDGITVHRYPFFQPQPAKSVDPYHAEYDNPDIQGVLARRLAAFKPDLVNAFHLYRLSAAAVDTVRAAGLPMTFTVTDFWPVCPAINLRLPDGAICRGPDGNSFNCIRHLVSAKVPGWVRFLPGPAVEAAARMIDRRQTGRPASMAGYAASMALRQPYLRGQLRRLDAVVVASRVVKERLARLGIARDHLHHIPFGINLDYMKDPPPKTQSDRLRIGFIGTISHLKGLHVLIAAFKSLPPDMPVELRIHGRLTDDPVYAKRVQEESAGHPHIHFLGSFPNPQIAQVFSQLDVLVVPSVWLENTPLVIASAQSAHTPVICTDLGGMSESVGHLENGMLFPVNDHARLAACLRRLVEEPGLLARLGAQARPQKSIAEYAGQLTDLYRTILKVPA